MIRVSVSPNLCRHSHFSAVITKRRALMGWWFFPPHIYFFKIFPSFFFFQFWLKSACSPWCVCNTQSSQAETNPAQRWLCSCRMAWFALHWQHGCVKGGTVSSGTTLSLQDLRAHRAGAGAPALLKRECWGKIKQIVTSKLLTPHRGDHLQCFKCHVKQYLQRSELGTQLANSFLLWQ